jgi:hypothetical protein
MQTFTPSAPVTNDLNFTRSVYSFVSDYVYTENYPEIPENFYKYSLYIL